MVLATPPDPAPHDAVVGRLVRNIPIASDTATVEAVLAMLRQHTYEAPDPIFVIGVDGELLGGLAVDALLRADNRQTLGALVDREWPRVQVHEDQEHAAGAALARRVTSVAVVDRDGRLVGAVPARSLLAILREEHVEDLHRLAGIQRETIRDHDALEGPPTRRARHRLPWLLVGLAGSMGAALIMSRFERVLERDLAIAFFVPAIVYLADAIGTQTEAIAVRGLSISRLTLGHLLAGELRTGLLIGAILGALAFPLVMFTVGSARLAIAVSTAIVAAGSVATTIGLLLPWLLQKRGYDPAFGSGPVATIIQDVASLVIYFLIATLVVD